MNYTYRDLFHPDLTPNRAAFANILRKKVQYEINLRICLEHGIRVPPTVPLGECGAWRAERVKTLDTSVIPLEERQSIRRDLALKLMQLRDAMLESAVGKREMREAAE